MKVLHVVPSFAPAWRYGGPVFATYELCRHLAAEGVDVTVFTTNINGDTDLDVPLERPVTMEGFRVRYFRVQRPRFYSFSLPLARALREEIRGYDLVHIHSVFNWPLAVASHYGRRYRVPYIVRPCGMLDPTAVWKEYAGRSLAGLKKMAHFALVERRALEGAAAMHYTSAQEQERARWLGLAQRAIVCPLGVTVGEATLSRAELGLPRDATIILFLSRLDPKKGLDLLIAAMAEICRRRSNVVLAVAGSGDVGYEAAVRTLACEQGMADRTAWFGAVEGTRKWSLLHAADVFALPSYQENFGIAAAEAMAAGLPVVVSDRVGLNVGGAGIVVPLAVPALGSALERLIDSSQERRRLGERAREIARREFDWGAIARCVVCEYEEIAA